MFWLFLPVILVAVILSVVGFVRALGAWFSLSRTRMDFQSRVSDEVVRLSVRTTKLEAGVNNLSRRSAELPIRLGELQQSISILQTLTGSLAASLRQVARVLTLSSLKTLSATSLGDAVGSFQSKVGRNRSEK